MCALCVVLVAALLGGCSLPSVLRGTEASRSIGKPCRAISHHPVRLVEDSGGRTLATFTLGGGTLHGSQQVAVEEAHAIAIYGAYVSDVRLGTYDPVDASGPASRVTCHLDPTLHFYCAARDAIDQLCVTVCAQGKCPVMAADRDQAGPGVTGGRRANGLSLWLAGAAS